MKLYCNNLIFPLVLLLQMLLLYSKQSDNVWTFPIYYLIVLAHENKDNKTLYNKDKRRRRGRKRKDETNRKIKKNGAKKQRVKSNGILEDKEKEEILGIVCFSLILVFKYPIGSLERN